ncbi:VOC family protein [uncultured Chryseobacterium sp.]|mgnify:CR=1 FL=1|uniref:VOC family protein n=1 Tax=uncultured Chryseobacterium sp. TaxID=259322 RepID=UPI002627430A|nr:VOC family protein [uncultured Chryseobacterium sp.]
MDNKATMGEVCDASSKSEVMLAIGSRSEEEITETTEKSGTSGGKILVEPQRSEGGFFGSTFADPDGHKWNFLLFEKGM